MMETLIIYSREKKNNLKLYLNDIYEKECVYKIEKEEVDFIQTGVETLMQELVDHIVADDTIDKRIWRTFSDELDFINYEICPEIVEAYYPIPKDSALHKFAAEKDGCIKTARSTIIKAGSFYDGSKNDFPDEFDFIFPLLCFRAASYDCYSTSFIEFYGIVKDEVEKNLSMSHYSSFSEKHQVTRKLELEKFLCRHGPAYKLQFIYNDGLKDQRYIHVDLVPAYRIIDINNQQWIVNDIHECVQPQTFRAEILSGGSCLLIKTSLAFTETEQRFMKNVLSKQHLKVTRVLKYLLNGNGDCEKFEEFVGDICYTSYCIKILMIYHHDACRNADADDLGPCVLQVLEEMCIYENPGDFPKFSYLSDMPNSSKYILLPFLKSTVATLRLMKTANNSYSYETHKIKSVPGQFLDLYKTLKKQRLQ